MMKYFSEMKSMLMKKYDACAERIINKGDFTTQDIELMHILTDAILDHCKLESMGCVEETDDVEDKIGDLIDALKAYKT